jgi:hypothetical protein
MMVIKKTLIYCLYVLLHDAAYSQVKFSPNVKKDFGREGQVTLMVADLARFEKKFRDKIVIHNEHKPSNVITITTSRSSVLKDIINDSNVLFIDQHEKVKEEATVDHTNSNFNRIAKAHTAFPTFLGSAQRISIKEQNFDSTDIDLKNRSFATSITPSTISQHATTMATLIAGGGNSSWKAQGVAPQARITASDFNILTPDDISLFTTNGIFLQNHSYGVGIENYYGSEAVAYDQQVYQNPTLLHVFSSGNSGQLQPTTGTYQGMSFANLTGNFKQAKNVLVVNAVDTTLLINVLNSRGPAFDGRVKPELAAFGQGGTSEAAALVSGIGALVQEKYFDMNGLPADASMVKAILIASADDIGPKGVDYLYGYGSVNAYTALQLVTNNQLISVSLSSNDQKAVPITVPANTAEIKIAVAWTDPATAVNSTFALTNDIDTWLTDGTTSTLPWVLSQYPASDSLLMQAKRRADHLNNIEYITLSNPLPGAYQLFLKSKALATATQEISVAYWMAQQKQFSWDFPDSTQAVEGGKKNLLTWQAETDQTGDLYLQLDQGSWQSIKNGIDLNIPFFWTPPNLLTSVKLKMVIGSAEFVSDPFLISPEIKMATAFNCTDSLGLSWNRAKTATGYNLYSLGSQYLQEFSSTQDTLVVLPKSGSLFFSVAPILNGKAGLRSEAINFTQQGTFCYLNLFSAERINASQVKLQVSLSSWHNVDHITVFKTTNGKQTVFAGVAPTTALSFSFFDNTLTAGSIIYQAEIFFNNGLTMFSDSIEIPIEGKGKAIVYPNPVSSSSSDLNIISDGTGTFRVLDVYGRILIEKNIELFEDAVDVVDLPRGFYLYQLLSGDQVTDTGRFVKY